jgi:DnaJ family protein A protein 2
VLQEKDHPVFKREKSNLILEHELSLVEALTGFQFVINHLDGRILYIRSTPGQIIKPGRFCFATELLFLIREI